MRGVTIGKYGKYRLSGENVRHDTYNSVEYFQGCDTDRHRHKYDF